MAAGQVGKLSLKIAGGALGALLTAVLVSSAFFRWNLSGEQPLLTPRFSLQDFFRDLPQHLDWLLAFALLTAAMLPLRALQWQRTLSKKVPFSDRYHFVAIGAFAHSALPGKLGDVLRAFLLARRQRIPFVHSLGSVAVAKLLEFAALILLVALSLLGPVGQALDQFVGAFRIAVVVCVGLVVLIVLLAHFAQPLAEALRKRRKLPRLQSFFGEVAVGLGTARSARGMAVAMAYSLPPVIANALAYGIGLAGMGLEGGIFAGAVVLGGIALGQSAPGIPVSMGVYYFVTSWMARQFGATAEQAAAYATLTHLTTLATQVGVGAISLWARKLGWKDLRRRGAVAAEEAKHAAEHDAEPARA
jgi:glycosyltransferase 2 family protein